MPMRSDNSNGLRWYCIDGSGVYGQKCDKVRSRETPSFSFSKAKEKEITSLMEQMGIGKRVIIYNGNHLGRW